MTDVMLYWHTMESNRYKRGKNTRISLKRRIFLVFIIVSIVATAAETFFVQRFFQRYVIDGSSAKVMAVAQRVAHDEEIIAGFAALDPVPVIQPLAERYRIISETSYVVVFNMNSIRYSHPIADRLGKHFVGGDERAALEGKTYISKAVGTLGLSIRAFVPILNAEEKQIGVVSVGLLLQDLDRETRRIGTVLLAAASFSLGLGLIGAILLARNIKKIIYGLEPHEIATLLEERNVIISSIKEGIVAIDRDERIILLNDNARLILGISGEVEGRPITEIIPDTRLPEVLKSGTARIDEEQVLSNKVILVNRIPLVSGAETIGAVATFRDLSEIRALAEELTEVHGYIDAMRAQNHEHLNRLHVVSGLLQLGKYDDAVRYIVKTVSVQQKTFDLLRTRVLEPDIAALLLAKINEAQEANIEVALAEEFFVPHLQAQVVPSLVTILGNLLQNAIEALRSLDRKDKRIFVDMHRAGDKMVIRVSDNGNGIAPEVRDRLFEWGATSKVGGKNMGIGLSLVKMHTTMFNGTVEVHEEAGVTVAVRLDAALVIEGEGR